MRTAICTGSCIPTLISAFLPRLLLHKSIDGLQTEKTVVQFTAFRDLVHNVTQQTNVGM